MSNTNGRRCVATKKTGNGVRRCARFAGDVAEVQHRGTFADLANILDWNAGATDLGIGAAIGVAGAGAAKYALANVPFLAANVPDIAKRAAPLLGAVVAGGAAFAFQGGRGAAKGHLLGAIASGVVLNGWDLLKTQFPALADPVVVDFNGYGLYSPSGLPPQLNGFNAVVDDPRPGMAHLAYAHLNGSDEDDAP